MAEIVIGVASSHSPQLSSGVDMWPDQAERDRRDPRLLGLDARYHSYDELLAAADPAIGRELRQEVWERKYHRAQAAIESLSTALHDARADLALVIGDDKRELFMDDGIPAFACFTGADLVDMAPGAGDFAALPRDIQAASWAVHGDKPAAHPVAQRLCAYIAEQLAWDDFDLTVLRTQPDGRTLGHAFTFPWRRLGLPAATPIAPVFVNTHYPPNVPSASRCYHLGRSLRRAVESWEAHARVAVIVSGGLSHSVIDEALDRRVLDSIAAKDPAALGALSRNQLRSGNSEILNWITAAGVLEGLTPHILDYVPGYRTLAGTGTGMAFARWE